MVLSRSGPRSLNRLRRGKDPGVENQHVDAAEALDASIEAAFNRFRVGEIASHSQGIDAGPHRLDRRIHIEGNHGGASLEEGLDAGLAIPEAARSPAPLPR